ncbi:uncharacterized protein LOC113366084 [Ctenocephalides felis]|uniref:uncharacterized protein LOC113366084 n=1 Tax=Ctenocephalides felis TaxID=7515 RepID=UPI000E6E1E93|nr:uncharacterized protein LOC113366084 [Ctenocephalides felis]
MTNIINELLLENLKSEHIVEYSIEQGLLRLSDELRKKFNVPVLRVVINASNDDCFGSTVSRVLIEEYLGYDDFLTSVLKNVARSHGSNGYIKNANTDEYFMINKCGEELFLCGSKERVPRSTDAEWLPDWHNTTRTYYYGHYRRKHRPGMTLNPISSFELLFFAVFGQTTTDQTREQSIKIQPAWTIYLYKIVFGIYMLVSVVVLINLLIAMMSDTYQRIQAQSDIEWKFGLSKLIRNMHRTSTAPSPLNLITTWFIWIVNACKMKMTKKKKPSLIHMMSGMQRSQGSPRTKAGAKWLSKVKKGQVGPKGEPVALSVVHLSPLGSQVSFTANTMRIENVADWEAISKRYRTLWGLDPEESSIKESEDTTSMVTETAGHNNINAVNAINPMNAITTATT